MKSGEKFHRSLANRWDLRIRVKWQGIKTRWNWRYDSYCENIFCRMIYVLGLFNPPYRWLEKINKMEAEELDNLELHYRCIFGDKIRKKYKNDNIK